MGEVSVRGDGAHRLQQPRHHRVPARRARPVLLHGDEHPDPGGAPGDRAGDRGRPGARADPPRRRRAPAPGSRRTSSYAGAPSSAGSTPRTRSPSRPGPGRSPATAPRAGTGCASTRCVRELHGAAVTTTRSWPSSSSTPRTADLAIAPAPAGPGRVRDRGHPDQHPLPPGRPGRRQLHLAGSTTPGSWSGFWPRRQAPDGSGRPSRRRRKPPADSLGNNPARCLDGRRRRHADRPRCRDSPAVPRSRHPLGATGARQPRRWTRTRSSKARPSSSRRAPSTRPSRSTRRSWTLDPRTSASSRRWASCTRRRTDNPQAAHFFTQVAESLRAGRLLPQGRRPLQAGPQAQPRPGRGQREAGRAAPAARADDRGDGLLPGGRRHHEQGG